MRFRALKIVLFFLCLLFLTECEKYPDGPIISLRTRKHRIIGNWDLESYIVNGVDSTSSIKNNPLYSKYDFKKGVHNSGDFIYTASNGGYSSFNGTWVLVNDMNQLETSIFLHNTTFNMGVYVAPYVVWDIQRLKEKQLWVKTNYNGKEYFLKFKQ